MFAGGAKIIVMPLYGDRHIFFNYYRLLPLKDTLFFLTFYRALPCIFGVFFLRSSGVQVDVILKR